jgi:hypothetical protein
MGHPGRNSYPAELVSAYRKYRSEKESEATYDIRDL